MALERRTIIDQIEVKRDGTLQVRMCSQIVAVDDPENPIMSQYHRTVVPPGSDVETQIAVVDQHLAAMGSGPCDASEWDRLRRLVKQMGGQA